MGMTVSLKLPAARETLENINDSVILFLAFPDFSAFQFPVPFSYNLKCFPVAFGKNKKNNKKQKQQQKPTASPQLNKEKKNK